MKILFKKRRFLILVFVGVFAVAVLNFFQSEVKTFFYFVSSPIQKTLWRIGDRIADFSGTIIKGGDLKKKVDELILNNQELIAQIVALKDLENENKILREALKIGLQKDFELVLVEVTGKDISQDFILIDKGSEAGISKNMPVITQQKVLIGKISTVYKNFSKVMLIFNKDFYFDAKISIPEKPALDEQPKNISGLVRGKGKFKIVFDLITQEKEITRGDVVVTSSIGGIFPKGLLVGEIETIKKIDVDPFQHLKIRPFFNIFEIETIFVISDF